jgi:choice-of-anchor A domain-containing protein
VATPSRHTFSGAVAACLLAASAVIGGVPAATAVLATNSDRVAADACPAPWPALHAGPPSGAFDGNVSVLVGGSLHVSGAAAGAEGTVVTLGDAIFARDVPGPYQVGVTALGSQVAPYAGADMLAVGGNLVAAPGTHVDVGQFLGGDVAVGGGVAAGSDVDPHGGRVDTGVADATAPYLDLVSQLAPMSAAFAGRPVTGTAEVTDDAITLTGDGVSNPQVFTLDGASVAQDGRSLQLLGVPQDAGVVVNITGPAVTLNIDTLLTPDGQPVDPLTDPYFPSLATHLLWNAPSATTVDIGGLAQLPGSLLVPTAPSTTTLSGLGTNGRILVAGDLVHTGEGELHAYPFLPDAQLGCTADPVHLTTLSLEVVLVDPDKVVDKDRFYEGHFKCTQGDEDVTPDDNTWKQRAGVGPRVLTDRIPAGAVCMISERLDLAPAPFRTWADPVVEPDVVVVAKRQNLGSKITNRVKDLPPVPPTQPSTPTPTPTATPTQSEEEVPEPPAPPAPSSSPTPSSIVEPTNGPELSGSPSALPTATPTTSPTSTSDAEAPNAEPPRESGSASPLTTTTAPFTLRGAFVWGPMLLLSLLTLVVRIRRRPKRLH